jgi:sodium-coupled neutral amino acid transporter 7/8
MTGAGYCLIGTAGYLAFPTVVSSNILNSFPADDPMLQLARAVLMVLQITSYPVNHHPARTAVKELLQHYTGRAFDGPAFHVLATLGFFGSSLGLAILVRQWW